jgi:transcriptional regulator with XRE-family HTH domain
MATNITDAELQQLLSKGLSQHEIARRTGIPRSTLRRRLQRLGTPTVYTGTQSPENAPETEDELLELLIWWRTRKRALQTSDDIEQETERKTYHVQKRYIEAIQRASDLEHVSITEIVNRAFAHYFNREHD